MLKSQKSPQMFTGIDATAFASVLAVVVFILWIAEAANPMVTRGVSADPPRALHSVSMPGALREDVMQVTILRDGQVYLGADRIWSDDLTKKIQDRLKDRGVERKVYVVADMRARWGTVKSVLDCIRSAGILRVAFMVNQRAS
ncbi:MAG: biopolymer transporter ExbD [Candidatus Sulfotelmatobacter sp.]